MSGSRTEIHVADVRAPSGSAPYLTDRLAGTNGEDHNSTALAGGQMATIVNGPQPIRMTFKGAAGASNQVAVTDQLLGPYGRFDWHVTTGTDDYVYVQSGDAATAYECWVWTSSGPRA